ADDGELEVAGGAVELQVRPGVALLLLDAQGAFLVRAREGQGGDKEADDGQGSDEALHHLSSFFSSPMLSRASLLSGPALRVNLNGDLATVAKRPSKRSLPREPSGLKYGLRISIRTAYSPAGTPSKAV